MFLVADSLPGRLWIMPCPSVTDIAAMRAQDVDTLVSLLPPEEMTALGVPDEAEICRMYQLAFIGLPIVDFGLPDMDAFSSLVSEINVMLVQGRGVVAHCRGGIGRSGMTVTGCLMALGWSCDDAIAQVSTARGVSIPDTVEQREFLHNFGSTLN